jgi:hypothetical protein
MTRPCSVADCQDAALKEKSLCSAHQKQYQFERYGRCPNHPERPNHTRSLQLCSSCYKKVYRARKLVTSDGDPRNATPEISRIVDHIISYIRPRRAKVARYLRTKAEVSHEVNACYALLMVLSEMDEHHERFAMARINEGASHLDRIPTYREGNYATYQAPQPASYPSLQSEGTYTSTWGTPDYTYAQ